MKYGIIRSWRWAVSGLMILLASGCIAFSPDAVEQDLAQVKSGQYQIDKHHATVLFKVQHMGLAPYVGRFNEFDATLTLDTNRLENSKLNATIEVDSLDVNYPEFGQELMGEAWFDSANHAQMVFQSTRISYDANGKLRAEGNLTLKGVTQPVSLAVHFIGATNHVMTGTYTLGFSATTTIKRSDFRVDKFIPVVADDVVIEIYAEFKKSGN
jgi:polyisoprenoid-binding protein YceI